MADFVGYAILFIAFGVLIVFIKKIIIPFWNMLTPWILFFLQLLFWSLLLYCFLFTAYVHYGNIDMNQMHQFLVYRDWLYQRAFSIQEIELPTKWSLIVYGGEFLDNLRK